MAGTLAGRLTVKSGGKRPGATMPRAYIGVDVGTTSTRAGVFDAAGPLLAAARHPIRIWHEAGDIVEQSSQDSWEACVRSVRAAVAEASIAPDSIGGIGF